PPLSTGPSGPRPAAPAATCAGGAEAARADRPPGAPAGPASGGRRRRSAGAARPLVEVGRALALPEDRATLFAWVACEFDDLARLREHLRGCGIDRDRMLAVAYWRRTPPGTSA
ncbi:hypothetical protein GAY29_26585, partial [Azospirillum brasilense]|uniref:SIP domain-containing protein n=1 Tax=Azospirillum brasilense TaxID=192 RepID=UPI00190D46A4